MSLQGSLDTIGLADVLNLLSTTAKSGELEVSGEGRSGQLWLTAGQLNGFAVGGSPTLVEALFQLMRVGTGRFSFAEGRQAPKPQPASAVAPMLQEAKGRLVEWRQIEAVVPSLDARVELAEEVPTAMSVSPTQWRLLVAIGDGKQVRAVLERRGLGEFDGCKAIKELADAKLVKIVVTNGSAPGRKDAPSGVVVGPAIQVPAPARSQASSGEPAGGTSPLVEGADRKADEAKPGPGAPAPKAPAPAAALPSPAVAPTPSADLNGQAPGHPQPATSGVTPPATGSKPLTATAPSAPAPAPSAGAGASTPGSPAPGSSPSPSPSPSAAVSGDDGEGGAKANAQS